MDPRDRRPMIHLLSLVLWVENFFNHFLSIWRMGLRYWVFDFTVPVICNFPLLCPRCSATCRTPVPPSSAPHPPTTTFPTFSILVPWSHVSSVCLPDCPLRDYGEANSRDCHHNCSLVPPSHISSDHGTLNFHTYSHKRGVFHHQPPLLSRHWSLLIIAPDHPF